MKVRDVIRRLWDDGWYEIGIRGDHRQFKHLVKPGRVTVSGALNDDVAPGTWNSIQRQAGWR